MAHVPRGLRLDYETDIVDPNQREYTFPFDAGGVDSDGMPDVRVQLGGVRQDTTAYRITLNPNGRGGRLLLLDGIPNAITLGAGQRLRIFRDTAVERSVLFGVSDYAPASAVESLAAKTNRILEELAFRGDPDELPSLSDIKPFARAGNVRGATNILPSDLTDGVKAYARMGGPLITAADIAGGLGPHSQRPLGQSDIDPFVKGFARSSGPTIPTTALTDRSVTSVKIADGAVTSAKIANDAVTAGKIASGVVGDDALEVGIVANIRGSADASTLAYTPATRVLRLAANASSQTMDGSITLPLASMTQAGLVELANQSEALGGADHTKAMTPFRVAEYLTQEVPADQRLPNPRASSEDRALIGQGSGMPPLYGLLPASSVSVDVTGFSKNLGPGTTTVQSLAQAVEDLMTGAPPPRATEAQALAGTDVAAYMSPDLVQDAIHAQTIPSGNMLPPKSTWRTGLRFRLLRNQTLTFRGDPLIHYTERDSSAISNEFALPGQTNAAGPRFIRSYSAAWGNAGNPLRNRVIIDAAQLTNPNAGAQFIWYPGNREYNAATDLYAVDDRPPAGGYNRFFRVGQNSQGTTLSFQGTDEGALTGGYHVNIVNWNAGDGDLYPATNTLVPKGDLTYVGDGRGAAGWIPTPGLGLNTEEVTALIRRLTVTEAITFLHDGPGIGFGRTTANSGTDARATHAFVPLPNDDGTAGSQFDITADLNQQGLLEFELSMTLVNPTDSHIGFGDSLQPTGRIAAFFNAADLRALTDVSPTLAPVQGTTGLEVGVLSVRQSTNTQRREIGAITVWLVRNGDNLQYRYEYDGSVAGFGWEDSVRITAAFIHQEGGAGGAADFTGLSDTPDDYTGQAGKLVAVNSGANALEFVDAPMGGGGVGTAGGKGRLIASAPIPAGTHTAGTRVPMNWTIDPAFTSDYSTVTDGGTGERLVMPTADEFPEGQCGFVMEVTVGTGANPPLASRSWLPAGALGSLMESSAPASDSASSYQIWYKVGCTVFGGTAGNRSVNIRYQRQLTERHRDAVDVYGSARDAILANTTISLYEWNAAGSGTGTGRGNGSQVERISGNAPTGNTADFAITEALWEANRSYNFNANAATPAGRDIIITVPGTKVGETMIVRNTSSSSRVFVMTDTWLTQVGRSDRSPTRVIELEDRTTAGQATQSLAVVMTPQVVEEVEVSPDFARVPNPEAGDAGRALFATGADAMAWRAPYAQHTSLATLPTSGMAVGDLHVVIEGTGVAAQVTRFFAVDATNLKCVGGISADLVNRNVGTPAGGTGGSPLAVATANQWRRIPVAATGDAAPWMRWDYRFPLMLVNLGGRNNTSAPWNYDNTWYTIDTAAIRGLTAATAGSAQATGQFIELGRVMGPAVAGGNISLWRVVAFGRTANDEILVNLRNTALQAFPLRIRGSAG